MGERRIPWSIRAAIVFVLYVLSGKIGLSISAFNHLATLLWAPTGIAIASTLILGRQIWPIIFFAALTVNLWMGAPPLVALLIGFGNTAEALFASAALERCRFNFKFEKVGDAISFFLFAAALAPVLSASIGVLAMLGAHLITPSQIFSTWFPWWLGDLMGALIFAPPLLVWSPSYLFSFTELRRFELLALFLSLGLLSSILFLGLPIFPPQFARVYLLFPLLLWMSLRFDSRITTMGNLFIIVIAVAGTTAGLGVFQDEGVNASLLDLQIFLAVAVSSSMLVTSIVMERRQENFWVEKEVERRTEQLAKSEEGFRLLVEGVKDYAICMLDSMGRVVSWNEGGRRIKGYESREIIGHSFSIFYTPEDVAKKKPQRDLKIATEQGRLEEKGWRIRKDGSRFWATITFTALRDSSGNLKGFSKITRDITKIKNTEEALKEAQLLLGEPQKLEIPDRFH